MKLEEARLCMDCGEIFSQLSLCTKCGSNSWVWVLGFIKEDVKESLFQTGVLYSTTAENAEEVTEGGG